MLPATNDKLRAICIKRSELDQVKRIHPDNYVLQGAARILQYEKSLTVQKMLYRKKLLEVKSFEPYMAF
jgi:hypothetical protein